RFSRPRGARGRVGPRRGSAGVAGRVVAGEVDGGRRSVVWQGERLDRWQRWLVEASSGPECSGVVHGALYVGRVLSDHTERVSGMIDWSEARVDDPAIDMAAHLMVFGEEGLAKLLLTYEAAGGRVWPRLAHHIAERLAFGAVTYALFALDSGNEEYLAAAKAQLAAAE
ncbi:phosphotransferase, partial [Escherichia coli]